MNSVGMDPGALVKETEALRTKAIFAEEGPPLPPMAEQYYLLAVSALEQAQRFAQLADYNLMQGR